MKFLHSIFTIQHSFQNLHSPFNIHHSKRIGIIFLALVILSVPVIYLLIQAKSAEAAWVDDDWGYRQEVPVTSTNGSAQSNVFVSFSLDTATLITAGKLQSSCQDIRITTQSGEVLPYHVGRTNACNNAATTIDFLLTSFPDLKSTYYVYYGNPSAVSADPGAFSQSEASNYSVGSLGTEAKAPVPVGYWKFDDAQGTTPQDSSTNNSDGSFSGAPSWQTDDMCVSSKCLKFDGSDDYVSLGHPTNLDVQGAFTLSAWVKPTSTPTGAGVITETYSGGSDKVQFELGFGISTGTDSTLRVGFYSGTTWYVASDAGGNSSAGDWIHAVGTWDGTTLKIYKNGILVGSSTPGVSASVDTEAIRIGLRHDTAGYFPGFIDDVKIYNFAQTAAQVQANYDSKSSKEGSSGVLGTSIQNNPNALSNGLVGYWKLNESSLTQDCTTYDATDSSGFGDPARSCPSTTGPAGGAVGKFGNGVDFDGTNDFLNLGNSNGLSLTSAFTLSAWIYPDAITGSARPIIIREQNSNTITYLLYIDTTSGQLGLNIKNGSSNNTALLSTNNLTASAWNHVVGIYDGSNMKVYINGALENTTTIAYSPPSTTGGPQTEFGDSSVDSFWGQYDGKMDEIRIYDRALNAADITQLYNFAPGPVGYWRMDDGTGTTAADASGNGNNGTLTNSPTWATGKFGKAVSFAGSDQNVNAGSGTSLDDPKSLTVSAWIYPTTVSGDYQIARKGTSGNGWTFYQSGTELKFQVDCSGGAYEITGQGVGIAANTWQYVSVTWNGGCTNTGANLYLNGVLKTSAVTSTGSGTYVSDASANLTIGIDGTSNDFLGRIDDLKVYHYVRTTQQIVQDMNAGHPAPGSPVGSTVATWRFDEGYGTTANDSSVNGNSLTLNTASWTSAGKFGKAWNGTGGAIRMSRTTDADLEFGAADSFAISGWFKTDSATNPSTQEYLVSDTSGNTDVGFNIYATTAGLICFGIDDDTTWSPDVESCTTGDFYDGTWHYFTAVRDTVADTTRLYIDAISRDSDTDSTTGTLDGDNTFFVGDIDTNDDGEEFSGDIDELKVYRFALSETQVKLDMNRGQSQVLGALGDNSGSAIRSASQEYCVPGSSDTCTAPIVEFRLDQKSGTSPANTGTNTTQGGFVGSPTWISGKIGGALSFDGVDDSATLASGITTPSTYTFEMWVNAATLTSNQYFLGDGSSNAPHMYFDASNLYIFHHHNGTNQYTVPYTFTTNRWYHIAYSFTQGSGSSIKVYIDGRLASGSWNDTGDGGQFGSYAMYLGSGGVGGTQYFNGKIDQARWFDYARTASQIAYDYNHGEPVAHWRMDECQGTTINDSSGNSLSGTLSLGAVETTSAGTCSTSSTSWGNGVTGKRNYSLDFDGSDDYVAVSDNSILDFTTDMTVAFWINQTTLRDQGFISKWSTSGDNRSWLIEATGASFDNFRLLVDADGIAGSNCGVASSGAALAAGTWYHLVVTFSSGTVNIYKNGVLNNTGTTSCTSTLFNSASSFSMGALATPGNYFDGKLDDVRAYNYALTASQVKQLYNGGTTRTGPVTGAP